MENLYSFIIVFVLAFSTTLILIPVSVYLGQRYGVVTKFGGRRQTEGDQRQISKLGGVAIFVGFTLAILVAQGLPVPRFDTYEIIRFTGLLLGGTFIFIIGVFDDVFEFGPVVLGVGQIVAAGIAVGFQIFIETLNNPLTGQQTEPWAYVVTVTLSMFWLGLMMNTVNFMDGLDGLAGGVAFIAGTLLFVNSAFVLDPPQISVSLLFLALMGASLGFVIYNFNPACIFMGGGAYYLGFLLGALSIIGGAKMATILLVMGLPLMDLVWQAVNRLLRGRNPMHGDRGHVHFRLLDMGFTQRQIVISYYFFCAFFGLLTLVTSSQLFKFIALGVMLLLVFIGFVLLARSHQTGSSTSS